MPAASIREQSAASRTLGLNRRIGNDSGSQSPAGLAPRLGGTAALVLFGMLLAAFVVQSGITQHIQSTLGFREPYLLFFIAHGTFTLIFPMHILYITKFDSNAIRNYLHILKETLRLHFSDPVSSSRDATSFPTRRLAITIFLVTIGMALPALLWYLAVSLASISSVTAIWNTNAFWAYILTVWLLEEDPELPSTTQIDESSTLNPFVRGRNWWKRLDASKLAAVGIACIGVIMVVYSGKDEDTDGTPSNGTVPTAPLAGILFTLLASVLYALVQVLYKKYISLPPTPTGASTHDSSPLATYRRLSTGTGEPDEAVDDDANRHHYSNGSTPQPEDAEDDPSEIEPEYNPAASLPFGLYANFITSLIGVGTLFFLWPLLLLSSGQNSAPSPSGSNFDLISSILVLACSGLVFNTTYLILLSIWGPVLISVGNLLTIILMLLVEVTIMNAPLPNLKAILGCSMIAGGFGVLLWGIKVDRK